MKKITKKHLYYIIFTLIILLLSSCHKQDDRIEMSLIADIWVGCNTPQYNTAIIKLNNKEYTFNLERIDGAYISTNTILIEKGIYNVELINIEGLVFYSKQNDLNGAVVRPSKYRTTYFEDANIEMQVFCR